MLKWDQADLHFCSTESVVALGSCFPVADAYLHHNQNTSQGKGKGKEGLEFKLELVAQQGEM